MGGLAEALEEGLFVERKHRLAGGRRRRNAHCVARRLLTRSGGARGWLVPQGRVCPPPGRSQWDAPHSTRVAVPRPAIPGRRLHPGADRPPPAADSPMPPGRRRSPASTSNSTRTGRCTGRPARRCSSPTCTWARPPRSGGRHRAAPQRHARGPRAALGAVSRGRARGGWSYSAATSSAPAGRVAALNASRASPGAAPMRTSRLTFRSTATTTTARGAPPRGWGVDVVAAPGGVRWRRPSPAHEPVDPAHQLCAVRSRAVQGVALPGARQTTTRASPASCLDHRRAILFPRSADSPDPRSSRRYAASGSWQPQGRISSSLPNAYSATANVSKTPLRPARQLATT